MVGRTQREWTEGPAKWAAVAVLGGASLTGIVWSIATGARRDSTESLVVRRGGAPIETRGQEWKESPAGDAAPLVPGTPRAARIELNSATRAELEALPGVGPELAKRIIEFRETRGRFRTVEQLDNVKGIGPKLMEKIRPLVRVEPAG